jgi:hypothetical protein
MNHRKYNINIIFRMGYRFRGNKGFLLRIAPIMLMPAERPILPYGGMSIGYSF